MFSGNSEVVSANCVDHDQNASLLSCLAKPVPLCVTFSPASKVLCSSLIDEGGDTALDEVYRQT